MGRRKLDRVRSDNKRPCREFTKRGSPCTALAMKGQDRCFLHDREFSKERLTKARLEGRYAPHRRDTLPPSEILKPRFAKAEKIRRFLEWLTEQVLIGSVSSNTARTVKGLVDSTLTLQAVVIDERLAQLEEALRGQLGLNLPALPLDLLGDEESESPEQRGRAGQTPSSEEIQ